MLILLAPIVVEVASNEPSDEAIRLSVARIRSPPMDTQVAARGPIRMQRHTLVNIHASVSDVAALHLN